MQAALNPSEFISIKDLKNSWMYPSPVAISYQLTIESQHSENRAQVERFIQVMFKRKHNASVSIFMPDIIRVINPDNSIVAACGLRLAKESSLFLERYLEQSVEHTLSEITGESISRNSIVEVGNLAVADPLSLEVLASKISWYLKRSRANWAVFTGIPILRNSLTKLGYKIVIIGEASSSGFSDEELAIWGTYYDNKPLIMAIKRNFNESK